MARTPHSTGAAASSIDHLLKLARRYPLLTASQEVQLGRAIRAWQDWPDGPDLAPRKVQIQGRRALDRFVCSNLKLAYRVARRYENRGVSNEDLLQSAIEGLITACRRFRPDLGYRSSSYSVWWMRLHCQQAIAAHGNGIRIPQTVHDLMGKMQAARRQWMQSHLEEPTTSELAEILGVSPAKLERTMEVARIAQVHSLDSLGSGDDEGQTIADRIGVCGPQVDPSLLEAQLQMQRRIAEMPNPQMRAVVHLLHLQDEPVSIARCARMLNLSRSQVQHLNQRALHFLKEPALELAEAQAGQGPIQLWSRGADTAALQFAA